MAKFDIEFNKVILAEGGYVNDKDDNGGETYLGISRKFNPNWKGWKIIDQVKKKYKSNKDITNALKKNKEVIKYAKELYKEKYWDVMELDDIKMSGVQHQMFDTAVNMGVTNAIRILQNVVKQKQTGVWSKELKNAINNYGES
mgnify:CR=1 FL=1